MLLPAMISVALYSAAVAYVDYEVLFDRFTNTAYERWWEGRRQWGALANASRKLALKLDAFLPQGHPARPSGTSLSRNTIKEWLRAEAGWEPRGAS